MWDFDQEQGNESTNSEAEPTDEEIRAQVEADIQKAQAALPPLDPSATDYIRDLMCGRPVSGPGSAERQAFNAQMDAYIRNAQGQPLRHIDPYPGMNYAPPGRFASPTHQDMFDFARGVPIPPAAFGPHITFVNDEPRNPSPDQSVTNATASMVEHGVVDSGLNSVNINSTTGGKHSLSPNHFSRHYEHGAVDINMINGQHVLPSNPDSRTLQDAFMRQPDIMENYGPSYQRRVRELGGAGFPVVGVREDHTTHDHFSSWAPRR